MDRPNVSPRGKDGVALVLVLGFLAMLLILAVSFATSMRLERLATRNYSDVVAARNLVDTALARAMEDYDTLVDGDMYPTFPVVPSAGGGGQVSNDFHESIFPFISPIYSNVVLALSNNLAWTDVQIAGAGGVEDVKGRFAYLIVDGSGLLDVNRVGGVPHDLGTNVNEIAATADLLSSMEIASEAGFGGSRTNWVRFETLPELWVLGSDDGIFTGGTQYPIHFMPYSYFPTGYWDVAAGAPEDVYDLTRPFDKAAIQAKLTSLGFANATDIANNIKDYLDEDFLLEGSENTMSAESVPMINEIVISNTVSATPAGSNVQWRSSISGAIELYYPFIYPTNTIDYEVQPLFVTRPAANANQIGHQVSSIFQPAPGPWSAAGQDFLVVTFSNTSPYVSVLASNAPPPSFPDSFRMGVRVRTGADDTVDASVLDWVEWEPVFGNTSPPASGGTNPVIEAVWQVDDPRINWEIANTNQWTLRSLPAPLVDHTLDAPNDTTTYVSGAIPNPDADEGPAMVAATRSGLDFRSVGEFGYLLYDPERPWHTIRFWGADADQTATVLDGFTMNPSTKGFVNMNSSNRNVLAAAFVDTPIDDIPGGPLLTTVPEAEALAIADAVIANGVYVNRSEIEVIQGAGWDWYTDLSNATNSIQREAVIRNAADLLRTRQNLYTVIAIAQTLSSSDEVTSEQVAVAMMWRDPYPPDPNRRHETFIRFFRWITD